MRLTLQLQHSDRLERVQAADKLCALGGSAEMAVPALVRALGDSESDVRVSAAKALGSIGKSSTIVINGLKQCLKDADLFVQMQAATALLRLDPSDAGPLHVLVKALKSDKDSICCTACYDIGVIGPLCQEAIPELRKALKSQSMSVRSCAAQTLSNIAPDDGWRDLMSLVDDANDTIAAISIQGIGNAGTKAETAVPLLIKRLEKKGICRLLAVQALGQINSTNRSAVLALVVLLSDADLMLQSAVVHALHQMGTNASDAVPGLIARINPGHVNSTLKDAPPGLDASTNYPLHYSGCDERSIRKEIIILLGELGSLAKDAEPLLLEIVHDPDSELQRCAELALIQIRTQKK